MCLTGIRPMARTLGITMWSFSPKSFLIAARLAIIESNCSEKKTHCDTCSNICNSCLVDVRPTAIQTYSKYSGGLSGGWGGHIITIFATTDGENCLIVFPKLYTIVKSSRVGLVFRLKIWLPSFLAAYAARPVCLFDNFYEWVSSGVELGEWHSVKYAFCVVRGTHAN